MDSRPPKTLRLRHSQLAFRKGPNQSLSIEEWIIRIGDLVALMVCAEYLKRIEGHRIAFQLMDKTHQAMKAEVLFADTLDEILREEGPEYGLTDPASPELHDPGPLWIAATHYYRRYGRLVVPRLRFDATQYTGPQLPEGPYAVFHPLFDPAYNRERGMSAAFVGAFCERLASALGDRLLVITDRPERIPSGIRTVASAGLYDLIHLLGHARVFIGGDTGFTHLAAAARVKHLVALYGPHYQQDFITAFSRLCYSDAVQAFSAWGKYWGSGADTRPKWDPEETKLDFHLLAGGQVTEAVQADLVERILAALRA